jgi:hypothetical protein
MRKCVLDVTRLCLPGIYRVDSSQTKRSFFGHADNLLSRMRELVSKFEAGECENEDFQNDFRTYVLDYGMELADSKIREQQVEIYKKTWPGGLY